MIDTDDMIHFSPDDVPDLPELPKHREKAPERRRTFTPPPEGWMPIGDIW